ncbi:hypothetical protein QQ045_003899 [Rhodiola kirilowii]
MPDSKVLVFGSFTEDETRSLLSQSSVSSKKQSHKSSAENNVVGVSGQPRVELNFGKGFPPVSEFQKKENGTAKVDTAVDNSLKVSKPSKENGSIHTPVFTNSLKSLGTNHVGKSISNEFKDGYLPNNQFSNLSMNHSEIKSNRDRLANGVVENSSLRTKDGEQKKVFAPTLDHCSLLPRGLINSGNLCFLNATLQALLSCPPFFQLLQELKGRDVPKDACPTITAFVKFVSDFVIHRTVSATKKSTTIVETASPFSPSMFEEVLKKFTPDIPSGLLGRPRQEDAQEFLSFVMDQMHNELLKIGGLASTSDSNLLKFSSTEDDEWETVGPKNKSAVTRTQSFVPSELSAIFGGQLISVVRARGNKASATVQPYLLLHLDIFPDAVQTVEDALHMYSVPETLEGYRAPVTGKAGVVTAMKSVQIKTLSKIMILHLMRFGYGSEGSTKLHKPVRFPLELVLSRELVVSSTTEGRRYELVATITHHGRDPSKGHYTTDARHPSGQWLHYDDASVTGIGINRVLHDQAYVLFYRQM